MSDDTVQNVGEVLSPEEGATPSSPGSGSGRRGNPQNLTHMGKGRQKGQVNKLTRTFKEAAEKAFEQGGGVEWLVGLMHGTASDRAAVLGLFGRLIPAQLQAQVDTTVRVELNWLGSRGIGRVTDADVKSLDAPQNMPAIQQVIEGEIVQAAAGQPVGNHIDGHLGGSTQYSGGSEPTDSHDQ